MKNNIMKMLKKDLNLSITIYEIRIIFINEIRNLTLKRRLKK